MQVIVGFLFRQLRFFPCSVEKICVLDKNSHVYRYKDQ